MDWLSYVFVYLLGGMSVILLQVYHISSFFDDIRSLLEGLVGG
jgi:hypothetical protein